MKIVYFTDTHDMGRNPGARIDDYHAAIMRKFNEVVDRAIAIKADAVVHGGDWWHTPKVANSIYNQHQRLLRRLRRKKIKVFVVPGNHDLYGYSLTTIDQTSIGSLAEAGLVTLLTREQSYPLTDAAGVTVQLHGREYSVDIDHDPATDYAITPSKRADFNFLFSHGMLLDKPFHPDVRYSLTKDVITQADAVFNGHYHPGYKTHCENGVEFYNIGSTGRDEGSIDSVNRMPQYAVIDVDSKGYLVKTHKYKSAQKGADVFDRSALVQKKTHERYLESFQQTIADAMTFDSFDPKDLLQNMTGIDPSVITDAMNRIVTQETVTHDGKLTGYVEKRHPIGIASVELINFQSHKKTKVTFNEKGLNALTGASDSGKTAIIRALRWVFYNEPKGTDFIRHGENRATVTVVFTDGSRLTRSRTKSGAGEYIVRDPKGKEVEFKGFGNHLPIDIANTHQMPKVELATGIERPLNFSYQLDGHFLLSESPAVRANTIGRLTGVHLVDAAIKETTKEIRQFTIAANAVEKQLAQLDDRLTAYADLTAEEKRLNTLKGLAQMAENIELEITELGDLQDEYIRNISLTKKFQTDLAKYGNMNKGFSSITRAELLSKDIATLQELHTEYFAVTHTIGTISDDLVIYDYLDKGTALLNRLDHLYASLRDLSALLDEHERASEDVKQYTRSLQRFQALSGVSLDDIDSRVKELAVLSELHTQWQEESQQVDLLTRKKDAAERLCADLSKEFSDRLKRNGNRCPTCSQTVASSIGDLIEHEHTFI